MITCQVTAFQTFDAPPRSKFRLILELHTDCYPTSITADPRLVPAGASVSSLTSELPAIQDSSTDE
jgi:hypothetical protein